MSQSVATTAFCVYCGTPTMMTKRDKMLNNTADTADTAIPRRKLFNDMEIIDESDIKIMKKLTDKDLLARRNPQHRISHRMRREGIVLSQSRRTAAVGQIITRTALVFTSSAVVVTRQPGRRRFPTGVKPQYLAFHTR
ncbi:unnamed protein product [Soboliphyme baturini]|uniref:30S ribosomal protein S18 n=1 Tax=Soboliphyme baturini TaxID=241478 RepID=A0A183IAY8_9BILA|nr:unnamed protein product [Soboliphyme baturini]